MYWQNSVEIRSTIAATSGLQLFQSIRLKDKIPLKYGIYIPSNNDNFI